MPLSPADGTTATGVSAVPTDGAATCTSFALALRRAAMAYFRHRLTAARAAFGVGAREGAALSELYVDGPLTPTELALRLTVTTAAVTELIDRLERAGHVTRTQHPTDRRKILVTMTGTAQATLLREWATYTDVLATATRRLDPEAGRAVTEVLETAAAALDRSAGLRSASAQPAT
jgi:DNA-binding MarR family transcriptional regulator